MKTDTRRTATLAELPQFARRSKRELGAIARQFTELHVAAGATIMRQGAVGREVVFIASGAATVWRDGEPVARLGPGDVAGEVALLERRERTATVIADTDLVVLVASGPEFAEVLALAPGLAETLRANIAA